jgi:CheY-like chemotaxis protein
MKKILCVDDDPVTQKLVTETLRKAGYDVCAAKDGIDCMRIVQKDKPDLVILDVMMPELNGYDVCQAIKFNPDLKDIPIVLLTSRDQELDPRMTDLMGIDYLHKSCTPFELLELLRDKLAKVA